MSNSILVGCDLHKKTLVLKWSVDSGAIKQRVFGNDPCSRRTMIKWLGEQRAATGARRVVFAYEASSQGFGLYDELRDCGIEAYVLAPTRIPRSRKVATSKTDLRDAQNILELLRGHVLAGNELPAVWVPSEETRDDRELVRMRVDLTDKRTKTKNQIQSLLKRKELLRPGGCGKGWTNDYLCWLDGLAGGKLEGLGLGGQAALGSLLRQLDMIQMEVKRLNALILNLSRQPRYARLVEAMTTITGVGVLTAMTFLVEIGDLGRFANRRQLASYLGLVPTSDESGLDDEHKGHIHRQGPSRVRRVLCQATWTLIRNDPKFGEKYRRVVEHCRKRSMIMVVAIMRQLAIMMWRRGLEGGPPVDQRPSGSGPAKQSAKGGKRLRGAAA